MKLCPDCNQRTLCPDSEMCSQCGPASGDAETYQDIPTGIPTPAQMADFFINGNDPKPDMQAGC